MATMWESSIELIDDVQNDETTQLTTSHEMICDYKRYCHEISCNIVFDDSSQQIGGPGKHVEIDKSKFGKRKYNRGRMIEGQWVLGGICREDEEVCLIPIPSHDKETLLPIIKERIAPGTTILTDCWKSYDCLSEEDFQHLTVNHSLNFVDPNTGCHTQNVELLWWCIKRTLLDTMTRHGQLYLNLAEFLWRNKRRKSPDIFKEFLPDAAKYYPGPKCNIWLLTKMV